MIGYCHHNVVTCRLSVFLTRFLTRCGRTCSRGSSWTWILSVSPSVPRIVALTVGVGRGVNRESCTVVFLIGDFLFTSGTFAVGCIARIVSNGNAWERRSQSYFDSHRQWERHLNQQVNCTKSTQFAAKFAYLTSKIEIFLGRGHTLPWWGKRQPLPTPRPTPLAPRSSCLRRSNSAFPEFFV